MNCDNIVIDEMDESDNNFEDTENNRFDDIENDRTDKSENNQRDDEVNDQTDKFESNQSDDKENDGRKESENNQIGDNDGTDKSENNQRDAIENDPLYKVENNQQDETESNQINNKENKEDGQTNISKMPSIPDDFCPVSIRKMIQELPQRGILYQGKGANKECGRYGRCLRPSEEECLKRAKRYAMEQSVKFVLHRQQQQQQKQQLDYVKKQQALMLMCRVYVGSIYYEVREDAVRQAFSPFGPIRSVSMTYDTLTNKHKGFAFIEYELPDAAQLALTQMNNAVLGGRNIKVGRPSNMPQAQPIINQLTEESKKYNRVYISSVHSGLTEQDLRCVFEAFGKVTECSLCKETPPGVPALPVGGHRGFGFIDYEQAGSANDAIASMNLFDLGGQLLRVGRAITPPEGLLPQGAPPTSPGGSSSFPTASAIAAANVTAKLQAYDVERSPVSSLSAINAQQMIDQAAVTGTILPALMPGNIPIVKPPSIIVPPAPIIDVEIETPSKIEENETTLPTRTILETEEMPLGNSQSPKVSEEPVNPEPEYKSIITPNLTEEQKSLLGLIDNSSCELQDDVTVKGREQRRLLMHKLMERQAESKVILLRNMVGPDEVDEELERDINEECSKYGTVSKVVISEEDCGDEEIVIKIFVEFEESKSAAKAIEAIDGRWFGGRTVKATTYDQNLFDIADYTG